MELQHFDPDAVASAPTPTKTDLLTQIEADFHAAKDRGDKDEMARLDTRHAAVTAAKTDAKARQAYNNAIAS